jgi:L-threonylcarbamoyladenylate synthase
MALILDWRQAAAPDDLPRQTAKALADGSLVVLPSEVGYVIVADAGRLTDPARPPGLPKQLTTFRLDGYFDPAPFLSTISGTAAERALALRIWPGAIGWMHDDSPFPAWVPTHMAVASVLAAHPAPLALFELNNAHPINPMQFADVADVLVIDEPARSGPLTLIRPNNGRWSIERPGIVSEESIRHALARKIVFVCTGNTCRSPMAEGMFKHRLAQCLQCKVDELPARGFVVSSAGVSALPNDPAAQDSIDVLSEFGIDLSGHRSRLASADLVARADDVIAMTRSHLLTIVNRYPVISGSLRLLCGPDGDLDDPIGGGSEVYRKCAATIHQHVERLIIEMGLS